MPLSQPTTSIAQNKISRWLGELKHTGYTAYLGLLLSLQIYAIVTTSVA